MKFKPMLGVTAEKDKIKFYEQFGFIPTSKSIKGDLYQMGYIFDPKLKTQYVKNKKTGIYEYTGELE